MKNNLNFLQIYKETEECLDSVSVDTLLYLFHALRDGCMAQCIVYMVLQSRMEGGVFNDKKY